MSEASGTYRAPVEDILLALDVAQLDQILELDDFGHVDRATVEVALGEFGRFASEVVATTDRIGDEVGSRLDPETGAVVTPEGFSHAYEQYVKSGWGALQFSEAEGGGGFPSVVGLALQEIFASANMALSLNPVLTQGAIELLLAWGDESQRATYLPRLMTGEWTGTMNLTEPEAGSDLGEVRTVAAPEPDGTWRLSGTKIFITWGEHDLAENIVHLVLARIPGAPAGTKGLSLFLVPKFLVGADGSLGERNTVRCARLEDKLGIHASPTCVMEFESAKGWLVGEQHGGLRAMFTMMNAARLSIGMEGPAVAERAFQMALAYSRDRLQGRATGVAPPTRSRIIEHPDVARMLLAIRTGVQAGRMLLYTAAAYGDLSRHDPDPSRRAEAQSYVDLLTPIAKAWGTDNGFSGSSLAVQVFGGIGYVEESGVAQHLRDSRIASIYEGTNGIHAIDLVVRKIGRDGGATMERLLGQIDATLSSRPAPEGALGDSWEILAQAKASLESTTRWMVKRLASAPEDALAGATAYLELAGLALGGWLMVRRALQAGGGPAEAATAGESDFFATEFVAKTAGLVRPVTSGSSRLAVLTS